jgi:hypothetical protein
MFQIFIILAAGVGGYFLSRNFVRGRLRFVDAIHAPWAPIVAGAVAFLVVWPTAWLPIVSAGPAVSAGIGVALGTARGAGMVRRAEATRGRLMP